MYTEGTHSVIFFCFRVFAAERQFTEDERREIVDSEMFQDFFSRASRLVERAMDEKVDIYFDYSGADRDDA